MSFELEANNNPTAGAGAGPPRLIEGGGLRAEHAKGAEGEEQEAENQKSGKTATEGPRSKKFASDPCSLTPDF